ncbi:hypothetical protein [Methylobacillus sp.]|uniref:hypothetical protein n=1 Tax=Methylobacillus sp. TaxID=56818 RepID=UPI0012C3D421|nr:hypothetical protein [Methylobacillus sp.]MPS48542.1 hypothetical protein [Methylobacillus sp.]
MTAMTKKTTTQTASQANSDQEKLRKFLARRHPEYFDLVAHWRFLVSCYEGGRGWFEHNIFRYIKEGDKEFKDRLARAYRFNHTREVVDLVNKYLFKMAVARNEADAPEFLRKFWANSTLNEINIDDFMKQISKMTSIFGRIWIVVDNNAPIGGVISKAQESKENIKAYAYIVTPDNAPDMSFDEYGNLNWILIQEQVRDDEDPLTSSGKITLRFRLWERHQWTLFRLKERSAGTKTPVKYDERLKNMGLDLAKYDVEVEGPTPHAFGKVPVFPADNVISDELYSSPSMIDDVAYLDRANANYLSNLDAIIQDQTFSQLIMPAQGILPGESGYDKIIEAGTKRIFTYDGQSGNKPEYISPDVRQAEIILKVINKIINEIYHTVGLAGERTKEDNALGIDNSSGVAKAYDFERVNSLLASKADSLELIENRLNEYVARWYDKELSEKLSLYPQNFDVRGLYDEFEIATKLQLIQAPEGVRRTQMDTVVDKLFPRMGKDLKAMIQAELKSWPPKPVEGDGEGKAEDDAKEKSVAPA